MKKKEMIIGLFAGLVLGVAATAILVWYVNEMPNPFAEKPQAARANTDDMPISLPGKPGDSTAPKPNVSIAPPPPNTSSPVPNATAPQATPAAAPGKRHFLQAGSFSNPEEADNLKAILAMQGLEANVRQVILQDKTFYRIILGPYEKIEDARESRAQLTRMGVESLLLNQE